MKPARRPSTGRLRGLNRLLTTLRDHGVTEYECGAVKVKLGPAPARPAEKAAPAGGGGPVDGDVAAARQMLRSVGLSEDQAADLAASLGGEG